MPIDVILADDHTLVRQAIRSMLERDPAIHVVGEAERGRDAVDLAIRLAPHVALMDLSMPTGGVEAIAQLRAHCPRVRPVVLSAHATDLWVQRAVEAGARGYILKTESRETLRDAVLSVHRGQDWYSPAVSTAAWKGVSQPRTARREGLSCLSTRQLQIMQLVVEGKSNREMSEMLGISPSTVDTHRTEMMRRLHVHDVTELVRIACREHLVSLE